MKLFRTSRGVVLEDGPDHFRLDLEWDDLFRAGDPSELVRKARSASSPVPPPGSDVLPPALGQEVWAAGVTYYRSRDARMEESSTTGGADFYSRVYDAARPELFFKSAPFRVRGPGEPIRVRGDARWSVPEPELALAVSAHGRIIGYTVGNDVSSRDIEGENPLYLPQAKVYDGSCALGPGLLLRREPLDPGTAIRMTIERGGENVFEGETTLAQLKRRPEELVSYLCRELSFPAGAYLLTGTGIVPENDFTLVSGDTVHIAVGGVGALVNRVA